MPFITLLTPLIKPEAQLAKDGIRPTPREPQQSPSFHQNPSMPAGFTLFDPQGKENPGTVPSQLHPSGHLPMRTRTPEHHIPTNGRTKHTTTTTPHSILQGLPRERERDPGVHKCLPYPKPPPPPTLITKAERKTSLPKPEERGE